MGTLYGQHWSATAYEGPWGTCVVASNGEGGCWADARRTATGVAIVCPLMIAGSAAPSVASLKVTLTDGSSVRVRIVAVGNERLWAVTIVSGQRLKSWIAYDASGKPAGSGG